MWKVSDYRALLSVLTALTLLCASAPVWAQSPAAGPAAGNSGATPDDSGGPRIQFTSVEHDFGQAPSGEDLKTSFTFRNVGDDVLVIEKVKGG